MKAWYCYTNYGDYQTIVYAETRGEAKSLAMRTDAMEDAQYTDIRCRRFPEMDEFYKGQYEFDWYDQNVRKVLVRDCGWQCEITSDDCDYCLAKEFCEKWEGFNDGILA